MNGTNKDRELWAKKRSTRAGTGKGLQKESFSRDGTIHAEQMIGAGYVLQYSMSKAGIRKGMGHDSKNRDGMRKGIWDKRVQ